MKINIYSVPATLKRDQDSDTGFSIKLHEEKKKLVGEDQGAGEISLANFESSVSQVSGENQTQMDLQIDMADFVMGSDNEKEIELQLRYIE